MATVWTSKEILSKRRRKLREVCRITEIGKGAQIQRVKLFLLQGRLITEDKEKCKEYRKNLDILNKMMKEKYDAYKAKGILGYRKEKIMLSTGKKRVRTLLKDRDS